MSSDSFGEGDLDLRPVAPEATSKGLVSVTARVAGLMLGESQTGKNCSTIVAGPDSCISLQLLEEWEERVKVSSRVRWKDLRSEGAQRYAVDVAS